MEKIKNKKYKTTIWNKEKTTPAPKKTAENGQKEEINFYRKIVNEKLKDQEMIKKAALIISEMMKSALNK